MNQSGLIINEPTIIATQTSRPERVFGKKPNANTLILMKTNFDGVRLLPLSGSQGPGYKMDVIRPSRVAGWRGCLSVIDTNSTPARYWVIMFLCLGAGTCGLKTGHLWAGWLEHFVSLPCSCTFFGVNLTAWMLR
jgi:hypothetical protein